MIGRLGLRESLKAKIDSDREAAKEDVTKEVDVAKAALRLAWVGRVAASAVLASMVALPATAQTRDEQIGAETAKRVEEEIGIYQAPLTSGYIEAIGSRLVGNLEDNQYTFRFHLVDQFAPNAFALPGGWVYVSRGLLVLANSEDELAGVIGHEITHVTRRHSASRQRRGILGGILQIPGNIVGVVVGEDLGQLVNAPLNTVSKISLASYSRGQENEADRLGMRLAARSGYDPTALAAILAHLQADVEMLTGERRESSFFDSHPTTPDRVANVTEEAEDLQWSTRPPIATEGREFLRRLDGLWYDENPAQGVFRGDQFLQPDLGFTITFPAGWTTLNTPSFVGAYADEQRAVALVAIAGNEDPATYGARFVARLREEHQAEPLESQAVESDEWTGYHVTLQERESRGGERSYLHYLWARMNGVTYQLVGAGADRYREELREMALTMRPLAAGDWESIAALRVRVSEARDGETLAQLGERTGNRWTPEYTALINDLAVSQPMEAGTLVKIARRERYRPQ
jgi:predicted Zn-dependent protease